jgi:hypothetical protein
VSGGIEDTTKGGHDFVRPFGHPDRPRYIEAMEAEGQQQLVNSTSLPVNTSDTDAEFEALGFIFGPPSADDPMFRPATLPEGWTREGSDHAMWSYILDEQGVQRVAIFYKAAWYDRRAFMRLASAVEGDAS